MIGQKMYTLPLAALALVALVVGYLVFGHP